MTLPPDDTGMALSVYGRVAEQLLFGSPTVFSEFINILEYLSKQSGTQVIKVDRFFPSSQLCSDCGYQNKGVKNLSIREWICPKCGEHHDRDRNAARNIHVEGLKIIS